jgi:hypothetical protein
LRKTKSSKTPNEEENQEQQILFERSAIAHIEMIYNPIDQSTGLWVVDLEKNTKGNTRFSNPRLSGKYKDFGDFDLIPHTRAYELAKNDFLYLPTKTSPFRNNQNLWDKTKQLILDYIDIPEDEAFINTQYIALTWVYDRLEVLPYRRFLGTHGSGKTQTLSVMAALCYRSLFFHSPTEAVLYRIIDELGPTLIIDEADFDRKTQQAIIRVLNSGYKKRGGGVPRCVGEDYEVKLFKVFGPKVVGNRKRFADPALESRCLTAFMKKTRSVSTPLVLDKRFYERAQNLRNMWLSWRILNYDRVFSIPSSIQLLEKVEARTRQTVGILSSIWYDKVFESYAYKVDERALEMAASTDQATLLEYLRGYLLDNKKDGFVGTREIAHALHDTMKSEHIGRLMSDMGFKSARQGNIRGFRVNQMFRDLVENKLVEFGLDEATQNYLAEVANLAEKQKTLQESTESSGALSE